MAPGRGAHAARVFAILAWTWVYGYGCSDVVTVLAPVGTVVISPSQETIIEGEEIVLQAAARDGSGHPMQGQTLAWASSDPSVATVDGTGVVRGLSPGAVSIEATIDGVSGNAQVIVVERPQIEPATDEVSFAGVGGMQSTQPVFVEIRSGSEAILSGLTASVEYPADSPDGWVTAELASTTTPTNLRIEVTPEELFGGTYEAEVLVSAPSASSLARIGILFDVESRPPALHVAPGAVGFSAAEDRPLPSPQSVALTNLGEGVLSGLSRTVVYPDEGPTGWLSAELENSVAPTNLLVSVAPGNLATGVYDATISVSSPVAVNGPQSVQVRLTVGDAPPEIGIEPTTVSMTHVEQSGSLPSAAVDIVNRGLGTLDDLSVGVTYPTGPQGWLDLDLDTPQTPAVLALSVVNGVLPLEAHDVYGAVVTISAPDAVNSPRTLNVRLEVIPRPSPEHSTIQADPTSILADGVSTSSIRIQVRDPRGDPISVGGSSVSIATTAGSLSGVTDNGDGTYSATLTSATAPGTAHITGTLNGVPINDTAQVTFESAATQLRVTVNETDPEPGASVTVTARLRDADGDPVPESGRTISWSATNGGSFSSATSNTNSSGVATVTFTTSTTPETSHVVTATDVQGGFSATSPSITTQAVDPEPTQLRVTVNETDPEPGASVTVTAQLRDADGDPVPESGRTISWSATNGGSFSSATSNTNSSGVATVTFTTSTTPETSHVVTATDVQGGFSATSPPITTQAVDPEPTQLRVTASETAPEPGASVTVTAQVRDADGDPVPESGRTISWSATNGGSFSSATSNTNSSGVATVTFTTSTTPETSHVVTATDVQGGFSATSPSITTQAVDPDPGPDPDPDPDPDPGPDPDPDPDPDPAPTQLRVTASETAPEPGASVTVTAQVRDADGDPVPESGRTISWSATNGGSFSSATSNTNSSGVATVTFTTSTTPETSHVVTATDVQGGFSATSPSITTQAAATLRYILTVSNTRPVVASSVTVTAQLADANGQPVAESGRTVAWSATNGGSFSSATSNTNSSGIATVTFTTARPPPRTEHVVTATDSDDAAITGTSPTITTQPGSPSG